jgi:hypothetical protein
MYYACKKHWLGKPCRKCWQTCTYEGCSLSKVPQPVTLVLIMHFVPRHVAALCKGNGNVQQMAKIEWQPIPQRRRFLPRRNFEAVRRWGECISVLRGLCRRTIRGCFHGRSELHLTMLSLVIQFVTPREPCTVNKLPRALIIWALERSDDKTQYSVPDIVITAGPVYWSCPHWAP